MILPSVFAHLDYRAFLKAWFEAKKEANPRFSHRAFVRRTGQRSPSLLADVIAGRRNLTPALVEGIGRALSLDAEEQDFFAALVQLDQASTRAEKNDAWERISSTRRFREARRIEGEGFRYLSRWYYPAIRELAALADFQADPAWIAATLCPPIRLDQAEEALRELVEMGMLAEDAEGRLRPTERTVTTAHQVAGLAVHNYHDGMLALARDSIDRFRSRDRHFCAVTAAIPRSLVPRLKAEMNAFQERMMALCDTAEDPADALVQIHAHFFPLILAPADPERTS